MMPASNGNGQQAAQPQPLLDRLAVLRDQAHDFGDLDLALTAHDARIALLHAAGLITGMRNVITDQAVRTARQRIRISEQVRIIKRLRSRHDAAHADNPLEGPDA